MRPPRFRCGLEHTHTHLRPPHHRVYEPPRRQLPYRWYQQQDSHCIADEAGGDEKCACNHKERTVDDGCDWRLPLGYRLLHPPHCRPALSHQDMGAQKAGSHHDAHRRPESDQLTGLDQQRQLDERQGNENATKQNAQHWLFLECSGQNKQSRAGWLVPCNAVRFGLRRRLARTGSWNLFGGPGYSWPGNLYAVARGSGSKAQRWTAGSTYPHYCFSSWRS